MLWHAEDFQTKLPEHHKEYLTLLHHHSDPDHLERE